MSAHAKNIVNAVSVAAAVVALFALVRLQVTGAASPSTMRVIGLALAIPAFICWVVARIQLGNSFSIQAKATALVSHGIYSKIRNPVYVFGTILIVGIILWLGHPIWLLVLLIIIPMQMWRAKKEAQVLEAKFGDAYRDYRAKTWF